MPPAARTTGDRPREAAYRQLAVARPIISRAIMTQAGVGRRLLALAPRDAGSSRSRARTVGVTPKQLRQLQKHDVSYQEMCF